LEQISLLGHLAILGMIVFYELEKYQRV